MASRCSPSAPLARPSDSVSRKTARPLLDDEQGSVGVSYHADPQSNEGVRASAEAGFLARQRKLPYSSVDCAGLTPDLPWFSAFSRCCPAYHTSGDFSCASLGRFGARAARRERKEGSIRLHLGHPVAPALRIGALPCALLAAAVVATLIGSVSIPPGETMHILLAKLGFPSGHATWPAGDEQIIWSLRVPRVIGAACVGAALAVAGSLFQGVLRNPLADPYVIGTAAGAQGGVILAIVLPIQIAWAGFGTVQVFAFVGAVATVLFVYSLAHTAGRTPVVTLLLAGFVVSSFLISATTMMMQLSGRLDQVMTWTFGSLDVSDLKQLSVTAPLILLAVAGAYGLGPRLDVLQLGEEQAMHLGVRVERLKLAAIAVASLLTALAVALSGIVPFVGLIVPHAARLVYGPAHRVLVPTAALSGALFTILADLIARSVIAPRVISLGVVTALIGAPFFLHLLRRARREYAV